MKILVILTSYSVTIEKLLSMKKKRLKIAVEIGDRAGEEGAYHKTGYGYFSLLQFETRWIILFPQWMPLIL